MSKENNTATSVESVQTDHIITAKFDKLLHGAFRLQREMSNETKFRQDLMEEWGLAGLKSNCRQAINNWENLITKTNRIPGNSKLSRDEIAAGLRENRIGREAEEIATEAYAMLSDITTGKFFIVEE